MRSNLKNNLNPKNLIIDTNDIKKLILYVSKLSKQINFYNSKNLIDGKWNNFFLDEAFVLAEISNYDINSINKESLDIIKNLDDFISDSQKQKILINFFNLIYDLLKTIDLWYTRISLSNITKKQTYIETQLEQAIKNRLIVILREFSSYANYFSQQNKIKFDFKSFNTIWNYEENEEDIFHNIGSEKSKFSSATKKLIFLYRPIYEVVLTIQSKSSDKFINSLNDKDDHDPHIGLLLAFFNLYEYPRKKINDFSTDHLDFFYKKILKQKPRGKSPNRLYMNIEINNDYESVYIPKEKEIIVGQEEDGSNIIFTNDREINLNNSKIEEVFSLFISDLDKIDYDSSYNLISNIYKKFHIKSNLEINSFNENNFSFSSLGEDQISKTNEEKTMDIAEYGFAVSSPIFISERSNKIIDFNLYLNIDSVQYLSNLIIDISNQTGESEQAIFNRIFSNAFTIEYTGEGGWVNSPDYKIIYPEDWSNGILSINLCIKKSDPIISRYNESIHGKKINTDLPVFQFTINSEGFYYPYSFLSGLEIYKLELKMEVDNLTNITAFNDFGGVSLDGDYEMFGPSPKLESKLLIGAYELFVKNVNNISIHWDFKNLPTQNFKISEYYDSYNDNLNNSSFKIKFDALSDYKFNRNKEQVAEYDLFEINDDKSVSKSRHIDIDNIGIFKILVNPDLSMEDIKDFNNNKESGFIKIELINPPMGFGFDQYSKVMNSFAEKNAKLVSQKKSISFKKPNEPFSPSISNLCIDYSASDLIDFQNQEKSLTKFFINHPFQGYIKSENNSSSYSNLVPSFENKGELILGFLDVKPNQFLNIFFEINKNQTVDYNFSTNLEFQYSSHTGWKKLGKESVIFDETYNITKTGVLCLKLNNDISTKSIISNNDNFYIKICSNDRVDQFSLIKKIILNAFLTTQILNSKSSNKKIPPNSTKEFRESIKGVMRINQPLSSFGSSRQESNLEFYQRISESLSHKNRPHIKSDIENFLIHNFSWLSFAKCLRINNNVTEIICLKKIDSNQVLNEMRLSNAEKNQILDKLKKYTSPFTKFKISNPIFEQVWIKGKICFNDLTSGEGLQKLNIDILEFICPWIHKDKLTSLDFEREIKNTEIFNFIKTRDYVSYFTGGSILHLKESQQGYFKFMDSSVHNMTTIKPSTNKSLIIIKNFNQIKVIDEKIFYAPEQTSYEDLGLESNFIVGDEDLDYEIDNSDFLNNQNEINNNPFTFNFKI